MLTPSRLWRLAVSMPGWMAGSVVEGMVEAEERGISTAEGEKASPSEGVVGKEDVEGGAGVSSGELMVRGFGACSVCG